MGFVLVLVLTLPHVAIKRSLLSKVPSCRPLHVIAVYRQASRARPGGKADACLAASLPHVQGEALVGFGYFQGWQPYSHAGPLCLRDSSPAACAAGLIRGQAHPSAARARQHASLHIRPPMQVGDEHRHDQLREERSCPCTFLLSYFPTLLRLYAVYC